MRDQLSRAFAAALGAFALALLPSAADAGSGAGPRAAFAAARPTFAGSFRHFHHHRGGAFTYWPGYYGDEGYAPSYGEPATVAPPASNDVRYTYSYDVPWDWAHRFPPMVAPSDHPYVPGCHDEPVTVPGRGGEHVVNVTRCY